MINRVVLLLLVGVVLLGAGEYYQNAGEVIITVTTDSLGLTTVDSGVHGLGKARGFGQSVMARFIMTPAKSAYAGLGNQDSCELVFWTDFGGRRETLATANCGELPCTLEYTSTAAELDTLLKDEIGLDWWLADSLSDTMFDVEYRLRKNVLLK